MTPRNELILRIINLIIIIILCIAIYVNGKGLDCEHCVLILKTNKPSFTSASYVQEEIEVKITDLYESIKEDKCVLRWDRNHGWLYGEVAYE